MTKQANVCAQKRCLALGASVEPKPHPSFSGGLGWTCEHCARTFSEPNPTVVGLCVGLNAVQP